MALKIKENFSGKILKNEKKKKDNQESLDNVQQGKKTFKTIFKNKDDAGKMMSTIEVVSMIFLQLTFLIGRQRNRSFSHFVRHYYDLSWREDHS